jgi:hypothetical protein
VTAEEHARRRLVDALDEVKAAARAYGLDPTAVGELYAPLAMRIDAWCYRVDRLLGGDIPTREVAA